MKREPALILAAIQAAITVAVVFGIGISDDQKEAVMAFAGAALALVTGAVVRSQVTPVP